MDRKDGGGMQYKGECHGDSSDPVQSNLDAPVPTTHLSLLGSGSLTFGQKSASRFSYTCTGQRRELNRSSSSSSDSHNKQLLGPWRRKKERKKKRCYRTFNSPSTATPNQCPTAVHHCSNPWRATPDLICSKTLRTANPRPCSGSIS